MPILVDTNVLLRSLQRHHPHFPFVERALSVLRAQREAMYVTVQNMVEFWAVATRPQNENGLGLTIELAHEELRMLKELFSVLPEPEGVFEKWEQLVTDYRVCGKTTHDAGLVAVMTLHKIPRLLTFNADYFKRYTGITIVNPLSYSL